MTNPTQDRVDSYISEVCHLLELERKEEELRAKNGSTIVGEVASIASGLGGCALVRLEKLTLLKEKKGSEDGPSGGKGNQRGASVAKAGKGKGKGKTQEPSITAVGGGTFAAGDPVTVRKPNDVESEVVRGVVTSVGDRFMVVSVEEFDEEWCDTKVLIALVPDDITFRRMRQALGVESGHGFSLKAFADCLGRRIVEMAFGDLEPQYCHHVPGVHRTSADPLPEGDADAACSSSAAHDLDLTPAMAFHNAGLDASQRRAVDLAVRATDCFLILGPPGSGKTTTVVEVIHQLLRTSNKILVCTPSNVAADNIVEKLATAWKAVKVVRLGHIARLLPTVQAFALDALVEQSDGAAIVKDIRKDIAATYRQMQKLGRRERVERNKLRGETRTLSKELRQKEAKSVRDVVSEATVVVCTAAAANDRYLRHSTFDVVIFDEAAQALEPGCWIPLLRAPKAILAGDPFQLPPVVLSQEALKQGLGVTLFERLFQKHKEAVCHMLGVQYRMHAAICRWSSGEFYSGRLTCHDSVASHLLTDLPGVTATDETASPMVFVDTAGLGFDEQATDEGSKYNELEAAVVVKYVDRLLAAGVAPAAVGVIAPYGAQAALLADALHGDGVGSSALEVSTVDKFQGREKEAVVISMVRSNPEGTVGFLVDERRMNVAITRARRHICVIGDSETMASDAFLKRIYDYFETHGDVYSAATYG